MLPPRARGPLRWLLSALALAGMIALHAREQLRWIEQDQVPWDGVCCDMSFNLVRLIQQDGGGAGLLPLPDQDQLFHDGGMNWIALYASRWIGTDADLMMWTQLAEIGITQILLWWIGVRLGGHLAGLTAAGLYPLIPGIAFSARRWAPFIPQSMFLVLALAALIASRSWSRPHWAGVFVLASLAGFLSSSMITDDLLFLASAGAVAAGGTLRGALLGRDARGERVRRWWSLLVALAVAAATTWGVWVVLSADGSQANYDIGYYMNELGLTPPADWRPRAGHEVAVIDQVAETSGLGAWSAYSRRLYARELTAFFGIPLLIALPLYLLRGRGRAELLLGAALPLLALSAVGKKLPYYAYLVLPLAPLITALGLVGVLRWRWRGEARTEPWWGAIPRGLVALALVGAGAWQWQIRSFPAEHPGEARRAWEGPHIDELRYFQLSVPPKLAPNTRRENVALVGALRGLLVNTCPETDRLQILGGEGDMQGIGMALLGESPCLHVFAWPHTAPDGADAWVIVDPREGETCVPERRAPWARSAISVREGWRQIGVEHVENPSRCVSLYRQD